MDVSRQGIRVLPSGLEGKRLYPTLITAHAGAESTQANTLESLRVLLDIGADAVEVDVRAAHGVLVLSHDRPLVIKGLTMLEEAFALLKEAHPKAFNLDLKSAGLIRETQRLAKVSGVLNRCLYTGDIGLQDDADILSGEIPLWLNEALLPEADRNQPLQAAQKRGFYIVNINWFKLTDRMLEKADRFSVWTVDHEDDLRSLLEAGVLNITTRRPSLALKLRSGIQQPFSKGEDL